MLELGSIGMSFIFTPTTYSPPSQDVPARNVPTFCAEFIPGSSK